MPRIVLFDPKLDPLSLSAISKEKKIFSFSTCLRCLDKKKVAKNLSEHVLRIKTKSHKVWTS